MRIEKCWFCSSSIYPGHGNIYVRNDAKMFRFCRPKCMKLFRKRVSSRRVKWTKISRRAMEKEISNDKVKMVECRLDQPRIYDRGTAEKVLLVMPKMVEVERRINDSFIKDRILSRQEIHKECDLKYIERHSELVTGVVLEDKAKDIKRKEKEPQTN